MNTYLTISKPCEMEDLVINANGFDYGILVTCPDVILYNPKVIGATKSCIEVANYDEEIGNIKLFNPELRKGVNHGMSVRGRSSHVTTYDSYVSDCNLHGLTCIDSPQNQWVWEKEGNEYRSVILTNNKDIKRVYLKVGRNLNADEWRVNGNYLYLNFKPEGTIVASTEQTHHITHVRPVVDGIKYNSVGKEGHGIVFDDAVSESLCIDGLVLNCDGVAYSNNAGRDNQFINNRGFNNYKLFQDINPAIGTIWQ